MMASATIEIRQFDASFRQWAARLLEHEWGSKLVVSRGRVHDALELPGFVAWLDGSPAGLVTYRMDEGDCELVTLNSQRPAVGIGTALLQAVVDIAREARCRRVWLVTTNDNLEALRFYQLRRFRLVAVHQDALNVSRKLKPEIPTVGHQGIPIRDELECELILEQDQ